MGAIPRWRADLEGFFTHPTIDDSGAKIRTGTGDS